MNQYDLHGYMERKVCGQNYFIPKSGRIIPEHGIWGDLPVLKEDIRMFDGKVKSELVPIFDAGTLGTLVVDLEIKKLRELDNFSGTRVVRKEIYDEE